MKKILSLILLLFPLVLWAQKKPPKPSVPKAERAFRNGELDKAKEIIDITVNSEKFADNAKAWYLRGVVYISLDTTANEAFKTLATDPFSTAKMCFEKYKKLEDQKKPVYLVNTQGLPIMPQQIKGNFAQYYFDTGFNLYQNDKAYKPAFSNVQKALFFIPEDTSALLNTGLFFAPSAGEDQAAIDYLRKYLEMGGQSEDAYTVLFSSYRDKLKDDEKALQIAKEAVAAHPENPNFPRYELDMYIKMNRLEDAKVAMQKEVDKNPKDVKSRYYLGLINRDLKDDEAALKNFQDVVTMEPDNLEARIAIAEIIYKDAKAIKSQMNALGISQEDQKKRLALDSKLVEKLKVALPYWETCEKIDPDNRKALDNLLSIYTNLGMDAQIKRVEGKMKKLGIF